MFKYENAVWLVFLSGSKNMVSWFIGTYEQMIEEFSGTSIKMAKCIGYCDDISFKHVKDS